MMMAQGGRSLLWTKTLKFFVWVRYQEELNIIFCFLLLFYFKVLTPFTYTEFIRKLLLIV